MILRKMTMTDADRMLEWKNYEETSQFAIISQDVLSREDHLKYLEKNLQYFQIIDNNFGAIRIKDNELSIWIDRKHRRKGIASFIIEQVSERGMIAKIKDGNIPSFRAFINAGFKPIEHKDNYYILQK